MESNCSTCTEEHDGDGKVEEDQEELSLFTVTLEMGPGLNLILCSSMSSFVFLKKGEQNDKKIGLITATLKVSQILVVI